MTTEEEQPEPPIKPRKLRKLAKEVLRVSQKAFFHKQDLLAPEDEKEWETAMEELHALIRDKKTEPADLRSQAEKVDALVSRHGGMFYHKKSRVENIEMFLVAAIVVLGVRSFFLQPFIIPTNSMYPTFNGMQPHVYESGEEPNMAEQVANKLLFGASHYRVVTENGGTTATISGPEPVRASFPNGRFFVLPTDADKYTVTIDGREDHTILLPPGVKLPPLRSGPFSKGDTVLAFDVELGDALFVDRFTYNFFPPKVGDPIVFKTENIAAYNRDVLNQRVYQPLLDYQRGYWEERPDIKIQFPSDIKNADQISAKNGKALFTKTGKEEWALTDHGKSRLRKDVLDNWPSEGKVYRAQFNPRKIQLDTGQRANVYLLHPIDDSNTLTEGIFLTPNEGNAIKYVPLIVFDETGTCYKVKSRNEEKYYIKRLVGIAGDVLEVKEGNLYRNDKPIEGSIAFERNRERAAGYNGYGAENLLAQNKSLSIPEKSFFAMGDNSNHSLDGRTWGFVPEQKIVGRALFIYYPFTKHWGLAE